jgi:hypothetical protein
MPELFNIFTSDLELITRIPIAKSNFPIDYHSTILSLGSCFAVNMADKFDYFQFKHSVNPFGILFHPPAIEKFIRASIDGKPFTEADVFFHNERWHCFDAHSDLSHQLQNQLLENLNWAILNTKEALADATHIIITLGTAWAYRNNASQNLVANCHKVPQKEFSKELLSIDIIADSLKQTIALLEYANPSAVIILTVSPVRHIKDGFVENQRSKAHLVAAIHQVIDQQSGHRSPIYFPSYEITMDELRDYRFYGEDMLHPNQIAVDYIWEKFASAWISPAAFPVMEEVDSIRKSLAHRPFNPDSDSHQDFIKTTSNKVAALQRQFPHIGF